MEAFEGPEGVEVDPILWRGLAGNDVLAEMNVPVFDLLRHCQERLLDVGGVLRRGLEEGDRELVREFLCPLSAP